jgi:branched-subunit amino acid transport protein
MNAFALLVLCGLLSWLLRVMLITIVPARRLPANLTASLDYVAPAVLAAVVTAELTGGVRGNPADAARVLLAVAVIALVAWRSHNLAATSIAGLMSVLVLDLGAILR